MSNIQLPGWSGSGYIILDPTTGDGSYKISGGKNGGEYHDQSLDKSFLSASIIPEGRAGQAISAILNFLSILLSPFFHNLSELLSLMADGQSLFDALKSCSKEVVIDILVLGSMFLIMGILLEFMVVTILVEAFFWAGTFAHLAAALFSFLWSAFSIDWLLGSMKKKLCSPA